MTDHQREPGGTSTAAGALTGFLVALETFDPERIMPWFHHDAVVEVPFAVDGHPRRIEGVEHIGRFFDRAAGVFAAISFLDVRVWQLLEPSMALGEFRSSGVLSGSGIPFGNTYLVTATARAGKLASYREFYDPQVIIRATGPTDAGRGRPGVPA